MQLLTGADVALPQMTFPYSRIRTGAVTHPPTHWCRRCLTSDNETDVKRRWPTSLQARSMTSLVRAADHSLTKAASFASLRFAQQAG